MRRQLASGLFRSQELQTIAIDWSMQESAASSSSQKEEQPDMECHICMDADVEVENDLCHHRMCIPCAKAVCSLPERAPQCPFCRAAITKLLPL